MRGRRQARRGSGASGPVWFAAGLVFGLGLATTAWIGGYLPRGDQTPPGLPSGRDEPPIAEFDEPARNRQYDFFTVLPEIEVVVPRQEIEERARAREEEAAPRTQGPYVLQVGSFRSDADAESMKARLALLGLSARIQTVTVDDTTWHRVRVGPFDSARDTDTVRRRLQDNGFDAMILRGG